MGMRDAEAIVRAIRELRAAVLATVSTIHCDIDLDEALEQWLDGQEEEAAK